MSKSQINIGGRLVGDNCEPLVVAEIGINHGGDLSVAKQMVDAAKRAGIEVIKHQTHIVDKEMSSAAKSVIPGNSNDSIYDIMKRCQLSEDEELELKRYTEEKGMIFISTPFSFAAVDRLERFGVCAYKIGSGEMNNYRLVEYIASKQKPIILSTGMNDLNKIEKAIKCIEKYHKDYIILHTTNLYPTPPELVRLNALTEIKEKFPNALIGLSDHTKTNTACICSLPMGACLVERHFTDTLSRKGEDIVCSMDESQARELVQACKDYYLMKGGHKEYIQQEQVTIDFAFNSIVAQENLVAGDIVSYENTTTRRPGNIGIPAHDYDMIIGKKLIRNKLAGEHIYYEDIE